jgi:nitrate/TMAO reductase-like tetraheme cytochrome c subunit
MWWMLGVFGGVVVLFTGTVEVTSRPSFCGNCHIMAPYVESWKTSHHNTVSCTKCHYTPGVKNYFAAKMQGFSMTVQYFTGTQGPLPWADVENASCLRSGCHSEQLLEGKAEFKGVIFDHKPHLTQMRRGKDLRCTSCHSQIVQGMHITVTENTCFLCHFKEVELGTSTASCLLCHSEKTQLMRKETALFKHSVVVKKKMDCQDCHSQVVLGTGPVPEDRCLSCHNEPKRLQQINDHIMLHRKHVTERKIECMNCHHEIQHTRKAAVESLPGDCNSCHADRHETIRRLYMGQGAHGVPEVPAPMFLARVDCKGCHTFEFGEVTRASVESCIKCHNQQARAIYEGWKNQVETGYQTVSRQITETRSALSRAAITGKKRKDAERVLERTDHNLRFVKAARGIHNVGYTEHIYTEGQKAINEVRAMVGLSAVPLLRSPAVAESARCIHCHTGMESVKVRLDGGKAFPHYPHIVKGRLACQGCHGEPHENRGKKIAFPDACNACHHAKTRTDCAICHNSGPEEPVPFAGKGFPHAIHAGAGLECKSCHAGGGKKPAPIIASELCVTCHGDDFFPPKKD